MTTLASQLQSLTQRVGTNSNKLRTEDERASFVANVRADLASIIHLYNTKVQPTLGSLEVQVLTDGIAGTNVYTKVGATVADGAAYYNSLTSQEKTIKETLDYFISELARLENLITNIDDAATYDDTVITTGLATVSDDLAQLTLDTMGPDYTLDSDGVANLAYSLSQVVDALGALFTGYVPTGNTYDTTYPALSFTGSTLQGAYDSGIVGAGDIELDNGLGHVIIKDDPVTPIETYLEWQDDSGATKGLLGKDGLELKTNTAKAILDKRVADPTYLADRGQVYTKADGTSGSTELHYKNSSASDAAVEVTRGPRVKELEVGCDFILGNRLVSIGSTVTNVTIGVAPNTDMQYQILEFPNAGTTTAYTHFTRPIDEAGQRPANLLVEVYSIPSTNAGVGNVAYTLTLYVNDTTAGVGSQIETLPLGSSIQPLNWNSLGSQTTPGFVMPADVNKIQRSVWSATLDDVSGLVTFKLQRDPTVGSDTYTGTVGILSMRVMWYR